MSPVVRRPAHFCSSPGSWPELGRLAALYVICYPNAPPPGFVRCTTPWPPRQPRGHHLPSPHRASGALLCRRLGPPPDPAAFSAALSPKWVLEPTPRCHSGPNSGVSFLVSGNHARRLPDPQSLHNSPTRAVAASSSGLFQWDRPDPVPPPT